MELGNQVTLSWVDEHLGWWIDLVTDRLLTRLGPAVDLAGALADAHHRMGGLTPPPTDGWPSPRAALRTFVHRRVRAQLREQLDDCYCQLDAAAGTVDVHARTLTASGQIGQALTLDPVVAWRLDTTLTGHLGPDPGHLGYLADALHETVFQVTQEVVLGGAVLTTVGVAPHYCAVQALRQLDSGMTDLWHTSPETGGALHDPADGPESACAQCQLNRGNNAAVEAAWRFLDEHLPPYPLSALLRTLTWLANVPDAHLAALAAAAGLSITEAADGWASRTSPGLPDSDRAARLAHWRTQLVTVATLGHPGERLLTALASGAGECL